MDDQPNQGPESFSSQPPCPEPNAPDRRRFSAFKALTVGALLGAVIAGGLYFGAAVVYLGVVQDCWG
jgi:hypothetical protein